MSSAHITFDTTGDKIARRVRIMRPSAVRNLFAAATRGLTEFIQLHFARGLWKFFWALVLTPFLFGLLYALRHTPARAGTHTLCTVDSALFAIILGALDALYLLFLAVQSAGLFGGPEYLAQRGVSYAEWARSGFFQMVGVTIVNLAAVMAALTRRAGAGGPSGGWRRRWWGRAWCFWPPPPGG